MCEIGDLKGGVWICLARRVVQLLVVYLMFSLVVWRFLSDAGKNYYRTRPYQHHCPLHLCPGPGALGIFRKGPSSGVTVSVLPSLLPVKMCLKIESVPSSALKMRAVFLWEYFWRKSSPFISFLPFLSCQQWSKGTHSLLCRWEADREYIMTAPWM